MTTLADLLITSLVNQGVRTVWGVVGDALNPVSDAIRRNDQIEWIGVRHEEAGAFAASAQAQLTGNLAVCMGTVGPGGVHLLNGLYDAKKSHAPVLAVVGQVPSAEIGTDMFQEVNNDVLYADVSVFSRTISNPEHFPYVLEQAVNSALNQRGVSVLTMPGDVGDLGVDHGGYQPSFVPAQPRTLPAPDLVQRAAALIDAADSVTLLVGRGALGARAEVLELAERLQAPMVLTLKGKEGFEHDNPYEVGQTGLIGNEAAQLALDGCHLLLMLGTDFPYRGWYPKGKTVIQVDDRGAHIGRRTPVTCALIGDAGATAAALSAAVEAKGKKAGRHLKLSRAAFLAWSKSQERLAVADHDAKPLGAVRKKFDNRENRIRPEQVAATVNAAAAPDAIYTSDTGMSTVWLARFVRLQAQQRLIGSYNLGSMANAMPHALGAQALDRSRQVISFSGDGGLSMLMGDLITAVSHHLPIKVIVFNNGRLGMVKLEMEQAGLPEFGTRLDNPDFAAVARAIGWHAVRVEDPSRVEEAVAEVLAHDGPALLDAVTNPNEIIIPAKPTVEQGWGFAIAKIRETLVSDA